MDLNRTPELLAAYPNVKPEPPAGLYRLRRPWDIGQIYYAGHPELMDPFGWRQSEVYLKSQMPTRYDQVVNAFDQLLASYGYVHENGLYRVERENRETLAFFCHFGVSCVLLSRLWNTSPFFLWQNLAMPTSSVTELFTEEREQGSAPLPRPAHWGRVASLRRKRTYFLCLPLLRSLQRFFRGDRKTLIRYQ